MKQKLAAIPRGWELVPVGVWLTAEDMVCCHPFKKWSNIGFVPHGPVNAKGTYLPYGFYIRRKRNAKKK